MPLGTEKAALLGSSGGSASADEVEYLVVGGGGGGGDTWGKSGGGGAGGYRTETGFAVSSGINITVTVGAGGAAASNGSDSVFSTITSTGGGGGGTVSGSGGDGGSGGGAGNQSTVYGDGNSGSFTPVEGYRGGVGQLNASDGLGNFAYMGGGGGGSSEYGGANNEGDGQNAPLYSGAKRDLGGDGTSNSITGSAVTYTAGGSASGWNTTRSWPESGSSVAAVVNTGGGGGGRTYYNTYVGAAGIVIIAYVDTFDDLTSVDSGLTCNGSTGNTTPDTARSGYKVYEFTAGTGNIVF
jgi:hypothetical protein